MDAIPAGTERAAHSVGHLAEIDSEWADYLAEHRAMITEACQKIIDAFA